MVLMGFVHLSAWTQGLPSAVSALLEHSQLPPEVVSLYVIDASPGVQTPLLSHRAQVAMNPASVMKLVTSVAALDLLGPAYFWQTQLWLEPAGRSADIKNGTLEGDLVIQGGGDPKLVIERLWLLLNRLRSLGVQTIAGDLVLDRSRFDVEDKNPAAFDGEPLRPYNASPDALLVNYKSIAITFTPMGAGHAWIHYEPMLAGVQLQTSVPLLADHPRAPCGDYRTGLRADFSDPQRIRFLGNYPKSCGERSWSVAYINPERFAGLVIRGLWEQMGGKIVGTVRSGKASAAAKPLFSFPSPSLGEVIRDMNKFSNNVMAQQLFLSLSLDEEPTGASSGASAGANFAASRRRLYEWWSKRLPDVPPPLIENGSGLSRQERITSIALGRLLQYAYASPTMPELLASLPQSGLDGTLKRSKATGVAHLKTGSLNHVASRAGYVQASSVGKEGRRYVLVAIINSDQAQVIANAPRFFDALIDWTARQ